MYDDYMDMKRDLDRLKKIFRRLHLKKEQEISMRRVGKGMPASQIREMREIETVVDTLLNKPRAAQNTMQKNLLENFKNQYRSQMRSWKNRLANAEKPRRVKRKKRVLVQPISKPVQ